MKKQNVWDVVNSTYWWTIELNPLHPRNTTSATLTGYSKAQGQSECADKHQRLTSVVLMFATQKYLERCKVIKMYKRVGSFIDKTNDNLILELTANDFCLYPEYTERREALIIFLKKVYNEVLQGKSVEYLKPLKVVNKNVHLDDQLNVSKYNFRKYSQLAVVTEKLLHNGHSKQAVAHFYIKGIEALERGGVRI